MKLRIYRPWGDTMHRSRWNMV